MWCGLTSQIYLSLSQVDIAAKTLSLFKSFGKGKSQENVFCSGKARFNFLGKGLCGIMSGFRRNSSHYQRMINMFS